MLPNWLYTQSVIDVHLVRTVAEHPAGRDGRPHPLAFSAVRASATCRSVN